MAFALPWRNDCRLSRSTYIYSIGFLIFVILHFAHGHNAIDQSNGHGNSLVKEIKHAVGDILVGDDGENSTMKNGTFNESEGLIEMLNEPLHMSQLRRLTMAVLRFLAQLLMIFGGVLPYIPQYAEIKKTQNAEGFSNYVCLTLLIANILRIEFWFGKRFETPLLIQSIVMILCMLIMLELWTRVHAKTLRSQVPSDLQVIPGSKEQLNEEPTEMRLTDFKIKYFWRWTSFASYLQFLFFLSAILSLITWIFIHQPIFVEGLGLAAVLCEALLGIPQFLRNFRLKSTEGMSVKMVLLWLAGDLFKTVYFIVRAAPKQFWICGSLQISIDILILFQVVIYSRKRQCFQP